MITRWAGFSSGNAVVSESGEPIMKVPAGISTNSMPSLLVSDGAGWVPSGGCALPGSSDRYGPGVRPASTRDNAVTSTLRSTPPAPKRRRFGRRDGPVVARLLLVVERWTSGWSCALTEGVTASCRGIASIGRGEGCGLGSGVGPDRLVLSARMALTMRSKLLGSKRLAQ